MCGICGCGTDEMHDHEGTADHEHAHEHGHDVLHRHQGDAHHHGEHGGHEHGNASLGSAKTRTRRLEADLLAANDRLAERNRAWLAGRKTATFNLIGSPGAGKTTLLEHTLRRLKNEMPLAVMEGDQATDRDALRIRATGAPVVQINTGTGCHLDAQMVFSALQTLDPAPGGLLLVENVGNLVCPSLFDLGERAKIVVMSVTEGADKPLKYPNIFRAASVLVLTKTDLLPHVDFDVEDCLRNARAIRPGLEVFRVSATGGEGLDPWCAWLRAQTGAKTPAPRGEVAPS